LQLPIVEVFGPASLGPSTQPGSPASDVPELDPEENVALALTLDPEEDAELAPDLDPEADREVEADTELVFEPEVALDVELPIVLCCPASVALPAASLPASGALAGLEHAARYTRTAHALATARERRSLHAKRELVPAPVTLSNTLASREFGDPEYGPRRLAPTVLLSAVPCQSRSAAPSQRLVGRKMSAPAASQQWRVR
jgi:hypothetical protein